MATKLEKKVQENIEKIGVYGNEKSVLLNYLDQIKCHDPWTYNHCLRVGIIFSNIADHFCLDQKLALYSGLLHDIGKITLPLSILRKRKGFNAKDYGVMKNHSMEGYEILRKDFPLIALVISRHHSYQHNHYPDKVPEDHRFSKRTHLLISEYSKLLAIIDYYDSIKTRKDDAFSVKREIPNAKKIKEKVLKEYPYKEEMIKELYKKKIFK